MSNARRHRAATHNSNKMTSPTLAVILSGLYATPPSPTETTTVLFAKDGLLA